MRDHGARRATGKELWRTRTIRHRASRAMRHGAACRSSVAFHVGTWMVPSYVELNLIYIGTSVSSPAPKFLSRTTRSTCHTTPRSR